MLKRTALLAFAVVAVSGAMVLTTNIAHSQGGGVKNQVWLQGVTPGVSQSGHSNISGTARAGSFIGGGAGLTGLNASNITSGTLNDARLSNNVAMRNEVNAFTMDNSFAGFVGVGTTGPALGTTLMEIRNTAATNAWNLVLRTPTAPDGQLRFYTGGNFADITHNAATDTLTIANDSLSINIDDIGLYTINTLAGQGASDLVLQTTNATNYGGMSIRSADGATGRPFYGYATPNMYSWTYIDEATDEWRLFHGTTDMIRVDNTGTIGIKQTPPGSTTAEVYLDVPAADGTVKDGIRSWVNGTSAPYGVWGRTLNGTGTGTGVRGGEGSTAATAYGVFADGNMGASGTKPFQIDHPTDPANKYLKHYASESPFPQNFYNGTVRTDGNGVAWVDLPDYFGEININFRYQLTVIDESDDFVMAKVSKKIVNNRFQVKTSKPNVEVSWEVKADRNDRYVQIEGAPSEVDKPDMLKGTYQFPEHWGQPETKSEDARRMQIARQEQQLQERNRKPVDYSKLQTAKKKGNVGSN